MAGSETRHPVTPPVALHLGVDADTHEIVATKLTSDNVGNVSELPELLDQIEADISVADDGRRA